MCKAGIANIGGRQTFQGPVTVSIRDMTRCLRKGSTGQRSHPGAPHKESVEFSGRKGNKLKQAAENLRDALPIVLQIATGIVRTTLSSSAE